MKKSNMTMIFFLTLISVNISAVELCVTDTAGLQFALAIADSNNQDDVIKMAAGNYNSPTGGFEYEGASEAFDLAISGGWTEFFDNPCGQQLVGMFESTIDGNSIQKGMTILSNDDSFVSITRISFVSGKDEFGAGGGLLVADGSLHLEHNVFLANSAGFDAAAFWYSSGGFSHVIRNNIFVNNNALITGGAVYINIESGANGVYFTNNLVINNNTASVNTDVSSGLNVRTFGSVQAYIGNNIFWNNEYNGLELLGDGMKYVRHNNIDSQTGQAADSAFGNVSVNPMFQPDKGDFSLQLNSPLVDAGIKANQVTNDFANNWSLGNFDLGGSDREQGSMVDIGPYESIPETPIFKNGFE